MAYVSGYLHGRHNNRKAFVYKLESGPDSPLYAVFNKYFDYLWLKYDPSLNIDHMEKWATWK